MGAVGFGNALLLYHVVISKTVGNLLRRANAETTFATLSIHDPSAKDLSFVEMTFGVRFQFGEYRRFPLKLL